MTKLRSKYLFGGTIKLETGLHIGGTNSSMSIGGPDANIIRNPLDNKPYIPGSSIKGKMRSLLEISTGKFDKVSNLNGPAQDGESADLFGNSSNNEKQHPSRLIVRDAVLISDEKLFENTDLPFSETKTEVVIDRLTSRAMPRQIERIPAGAEFALDMVLNVMDDEDENVLLKNLFKSMRLLKDDYLGGNGSRGYGKISMDIKAIIKRTTGYYEGQSKEEDVTEKYSEDIQKLR